MHLYEVEMLIARHRILLSLGFEEDAFSELEKAEELCAEVAENYGYKGWRLPNSCRPSPEIADIWDFHYGYGSWRASEAEDDARMLSCETYNESARHPAWVYCPRGHNAVFSKDGYDECAACGAPMTPADEETYFDALCAAGQCM